jgi:DHA2 family multidrug resistance protein
MHLDTIGLSLLVLGVAALQIFLDKGQEDDWLGSSFITTLVVISVVCLGALIVWEWRHKAPLVDVKLYRSFNFSGVNLMMFLAGAVAFSSTVLMPQFLQILAGYTAQQAGLVVSAGAASLFVSMPLIAFLSTKIAAKHLIAFGWFLSATGLFLSARLLTLGVSFSTAAVIMVLQYAPVGFIFVPAVTASYFGISRSRSDEVAGLTNFVRNIGSSVGASLVTTVLARRQQFHIARLTEHLSPGAPALTVFFNGLASRAHSSGGSGGQAMGLAMVYQFLMAHAASLSYLDTYVVLGTGSAAMFFLSFLLKSNNPRAPEQEAAH